MLKSADANPGYAVEKDRNSKKLGATRLTLDSGEWAYFESSVKARKFYTKNWVHADPVLGAFYVVVTLDFNKLDYVGDVELNAIEHTVESIRFTKLAIELP